MDINNDKWEQEPQWLRDLVRLQLQLDSVDPDTEILLQLIEFWSMAEILRLGVLAHLQSREDI